MSVPFHAHAIQFSGHPEITWWVLHPFLPQKDFDAALRDRRLQLPLFFARGLDFLEQLSVLPDLRLTLPVKGPTHSKPIRCERHDKDAADAQSANAWRAHGLNE